MEQDNIPKIECPAQSPELNIIKNCWRKQKQELCKWVQNVRTANDLKTAIRHPNFIQDSMQNPSSNKCKRVFNKISMLGKTCKMIQTEEKH